MSMSRNRTAFPSMDSSGGMASKRAPTASIQTQQHINPGPIRTWSVEDCGNWVRSLNAKMARVADLFVAEGVDGEMMVELSDQILTEMGVSSTLYRKKILSNVEKHKRLKRGISKSALDLPEADLDAKPQFGRTLGSRSVELPSTPGLSSRQASVNSAAGSPAMPQRRKNGPITGRERLAQAEAMIRQLQQELAEVNARGGEQELKTQNILLKKELQILKVELQNNGGELLAQKEEELQNLQVKFTTMQDAQMNEIRLLKGELDIKNQELQDMNFQLQQAVHLQQELQEENERAVSRYYLLQKEKGNSEDLVNELASTKADLKQAQGNLQKSIQEISDREVKLTRVQNEYDELVNMSKMLMDQLDQAKARLAETRREQDMSTTPGGSSEVEALNAELSQLQEQIHTQDGAMTKLQQLLADAEKALAAKDELLEATSVNSTDVQSKLKELQQNNQILQKENADLSARLSNARAESEVLSTKLKSNTDVESMNEELVFKVSSLEKKLRVTAEQHTEDLSLQEGRVDDLKKQIASMQEENSALLNKITTIASTQSSNKLANNEMQAQMERLMKDRDRAKEELLESQDRVEDLMGKMKQISRSLSESETDSQDLRTQLAALKRSQGENDMERGELEVKLQRLEKLNSNLKSELEEVENRLQDQTLKYKRIVSENKGLLVEKEDLEETLASVRSHAMSVDSMSSKMEIGNLEAQMDHLISEKTQFQIKSDKLEQEVKRLQEQNEELQSEKNDLAKKFNELEVRGASSSSEIQTMRVNFQKLAGENASLQTEMELLKVQSKKTAGKFAEAKVECQELKEQIEDLNVQVEDFQAKVEELDLQVEELDEVNKELQTRLEAKGEEMEHHDEQDQEEIKRLKDELETSKMQIEELTAERDELQGQMDFLNAMKEKFEKTDMHAMYVENEDMKKKIELGKQTLGKMQEQIMMLKNKTNVLEDEHNTLKGKYDRLQETNEDLEEAMEGMEARYQKAILVAMEQEEKLDLFVGGTDTEDQKMSSKLQRKLKSIENEKRMLEDDLSFIREDFHEQQSYMRDLTELVQTFGPQFDTVNDPGLQDFFTTLREISVNMVKELEEDGLPHMGADDSNYEFDVKECISGDDDDDIERIKGPESDEEDGTILEVEKQVRKSSVKI